MQSTGHDSWNGPCRSQARMLSMVSLLKPYVDRCCPVTVGGERYGHAGVCRPSEADKPYQSDVVASQVSAAALLECAGPFPPFRHNLQIPDLHSHTCKAGRKLGPYCKAVQDPLAAVAAGLSSCPTCLKFLHKVGTNNLWAGDTPSMCISSQSSLLH